MIDPKDWLLHGRPLDWQLSTDLATAMGAADINECLAFGVTPLQALAFATVSDPQTSFAACLANGEVMGALGWTKDGSIWSLWRPLSRRLAKEVIERTDEVVHMMVTRSDRDYLSNFVHSEHTVAIRWIRHSGVFKIDDYAHPLPHKRGHLFHYFRTV